MYVSYTHWGIIFFVFWIIHRDTMYSAILCQIGHAPLTPETSFILDPFGFQTQTPMIASLCQDTTQLSRKSVLVPVLTGRGVDVLRILEIPNVMALFFGSERTVLMRKISFSFFHVKKRNASTTFSRDVSSVQRTMPYP